MKWWQILRHFHKQPAVIAAWCRSLGPVLRWLTAPRRRLLLAIGAVWIAIRLPSKASRKAGEFVDIEPGWETAVALIVAASLFVWICYVAARNFSRWPKFAQRHPQICLHALFWILLALLWTSQPACAPLQVVLVGGALLMPFLLWRIGYMLFTAQRGKMAGTKFTDHWFYIWPVWGGSSTPYGKGFDYLSSSEAKDSEALAKSQLAGIKLFVLAAIAALGEGLIEGIVFGDDNRYRRLLGFSLGIPTMGELFAHPTAHPEWQGWAAIYIDLIRLVLHWAAKGHIVIGYLRLCGFYVFRNTYKPLLAETIVEFWNRYYYYFKELLVNFFFFPSFTRYFKTRPQLRLLAAIFAAAFFGNMYYHIIDSPALVCGDAASLWKNFNARLVYCFLLALGLFFSMSREGKRDRSAPPRRFGRRLVAIFGVWTFFAISHIWAKRESASALERLQFFFGLFGLN